MTSSCLAKPFMSALLNMFNSLDCCFVTAIAGRGRNHIETGRSVSYNRRANPSAARTRLRAAASK